MRYIYGMRLRGFSPGCQPMNGIIDWSDNTDMYHSILAYDRELSEKELEEYELDYICEEQEER